MRRQGTGRRFSSVVAAFTVACGVLAGLVAPAGSGVASQRYGTYGWAGYAWHTGSRQVTASLRLPYVYPARNAGAAFWAGFGTGPGIEQTGFTANMVGGRLRWTAWYEMYPAPPAGFGRAAYSGDYVSMAVTYRGGGWFTLTVQDATRHWTASVLRHAPVLTLGTAEVIVEAYGPPLPRFGPARFYNISASYGWAYRIAGTSVSPFRGHSFTVQH